MIVPGPAFRTRSRCLLLPGHVVPNMGFIDGKLHESSEGIRSSFSILVGGYGVGAGRASNVPGRTADGMATSVHGAVHEMANRGSAPMAAGRAPRRMEALMRFRALPESSSMASIVPRNRDADADAIACVVDHVRNPH